MITWEKISQKLWPQWDINNITNKKEVGKNSTSFPANEGWSMVLISDGNSVIGTHVRSNLCYLISFRPWITSRAVTNRIFIPPKRLVYFIIVQHVLIYLLIQVPWGDPSQAKKSCRYPQSLVLQFVHCVQNRVEDPDSNVWVGSRFSFRFWRYQEISSYK